MNKDTTTAGLHPTAAAAGGLCPLIAKVKVTFFRVDNDNPAFRTDQQRSTLLDMYTIMATAALHKIDQLQLGQPRLTLEGPDEARALSDLNMDLENLQARPSRAGVEDIEERVAEIKEHLKPLVFLDRVVARFLRTGPAQQPAGDWWMQNRLGKHETKEQLARTWPDFAKGDARQHMGKRMAWQLQAMRVTCFHIELWLHKWFTDTKEAATQLSTMKELFKELAVIVEGVRHFEEPIDAIDPSIHHQAFKTRLARLHSLLERSSGSARLSALGSDLYSMFPKPPTAK